MNIIEVCNKCFKNHGEPSLSIVFESKSDYRNRDDFFDKLKNELDIDVENMNKLTEISKTDFINYPIFKWIDPINLRIEFGNYDKFYLVGESKYPEDSCLLAESDSIFCIFRFYDAT